MVIAPHPHFFCEFPSFAIALTRMRASVPCFGDAPLPAGASLSSSV